MSIGYACLVAGVSDMNFKTCTLKNATDERLYEIIDHNLDVLESILEYNYHNEIKLFRISSDIIPLGSHQEVFYDWQTIFKTKLYEIGLKLKEYNIRVSMHPGQYTVLNSNKDEVVHKAIKDLTYHNDFLDALNTDTSSKLILHIGGVYDNKETAIQRFIDNYNKLSIKIKNRLVIENDDKSYHIEDVLYISKQCEIPVVFDNLHHEINHPDNDNTYEYYLAKVKKTWLKKDGHPKIHYSQQAKAKKVGSHSQTIDLEVFIKFYQPLENQAIDIMLEVKDKNLSAIKCLNINKNNINNLENEFALYKYSILEHSHKDYLKIRELLKDKNSYHVVEFYQIVDEALNKEINLKDSINAAYHVWGYYKNLVDEKEKKMVLRKLEMYSNSEISLKTLKNILKKLSLKYPIKYLSQSYYFTL